jgi:Lsr2 protein/uncharacterized protein DUF2637
VNLLSRFAWLIVATSALTLSAWSLYVVARRYGVPPPLAAVTSTAFDGAALICADLALRYARSHGDSGAAPRLGVLILAASSAYLNAQHAYMARDPRPAVLMYSAPPVIALSLFELHSRWERREALRLAGRVAESLPPLGRYSWALFPLRTLRTLRGIIAARLDEKAVTAGRKPSRGKHSGNDARRWARDNGYNVADRGRLPRDVIAQFEAQSQGQGSDVDPDATVVMSRISPQDERTRIVVMPSGGRYVVPAPDSE